MPSYVNIGAGAFGDNTWRNLLFRWDGTTATTYMNGTLITNNTGTFANTAGDLLFGRHANGANYGFGDGAVWFLSTSMDPTTFALLGSMADEVPVSPDD